MERVTSRLGEVRLAPDGPVVAGSMGQWTVTLTVGSYGIDEGGTIKLAQRFAADWETPQFEHPKASGYTTVTTSGAARLRPYFHAKAHERPWMKCLVIDVFDGSLAPGDVVTIVLGDRSQGSPGIRAQTFQESAHEFRVLVDPTNASRAVSLPTSPKFPVMAGPPAALVCIVPSQARVGAAVEVFVKGEDQWGNPTAAPAQVELMWESDPSFAGDITIEAGSSIVASRPGRGWVLARAVTQGGVFSVRSNPIEFAAAETTATGRRSGPLQRYWGDLHAQSAGTVGTGDEDEYFTFARDAARLDFASHQGNDFQIDDEYWAHLNTTVAKFHEDGTFVVFPGYEWSANSPAGGDRNVFYRREGMPILRSSHWQIPHVPENELSPAHPADVLFARLREHVSAADVLLGAHVGGRYADVRRYFDEERGGLVEVLSCWGVFEWILWDALDKGYVVGVMCNSDGHKGRPGAEGPGAGEFGIRGGLTCVLAEAQTRDAIWRGLQARHCYGTSGARITLDFHAQSSDGSRYMMGDLICGSSGQLTLTASAVGCAPLESLTLFQGRQPLRTVRPAVFGRGEDSPRVRVGWAGSRIRGRGRRVTWDGEIQLAGATILRAATVAFDAHSDGILAQEAQRVQFRSATTGDSDMIDLWLADDSRGVLTFHSQAGDATFDLTTLARVGERTEIDFGGLDMRVWVERYPDHLSEAEGNLALEIQVQCEPPEAVRTPYWVKAVQTDGQMAWSSPIYVAR